MSKFKLQVNGEERAFTVTRQGDKLRVVANGEGLETTTAEFQLVYKDGARYVLERVAADGSQRRVEIAGHLDGDERQVWVNGRSLRYRRLRRSGATGATPAGSLAASIPAVVSEILASEGDTVRAGDKLVLLESMKMVIPIRAPHDGIVTAIRCREGESVQAGVALLELEKPSELEKDKT